MSQVPGAVTGDVSIQCNHFAVRPSERRTSVMSFVHICHVLAFDTPRRSSFCVDNAPLKDEITAQSTGKQIALCFRL